MNNKLGIYFLTELWQQSDSMSASLQNSHHFFFLLYNRGVVLPIENILQPRRWVNNILRLLCKNSTSHL